MRSCKGAHAKFLVVQPTAETGRGNESIVGDAYTIAAGIRDKRLSPLHRLVASAERRPLQVRSRLRNTFEKLCSRR